VHGEEVMGDGKIEERKYMDGLSIHIYYILYIHIYICVCVCLFNDVRI
jgi:hypothetical protein